MPTREAWDSVLTIDAMTCLRKFFYLHVEGWRPRKPSVDLFFGQLYASALEQFHKLIAVGTEKDEALRAVIRSTLLASWLDGRPWVSDDNNKNRETLIRTIVWYIDQFGADDSMKVVFLSDGKPAVEYSFTFELGPSLVYCGHIDRLVEYQGDHFVQDQKTTRKTLGSVYFQQYDHPHQQITGYIFAGKVIYGKPVKGAIIDAAQVAVGFSRFERGFTTRTPAQLDEWRGTAIAAIERANAGEYPMNPAACYLCNFKSVCSKDPSVREQFLLADFEKRPLWDPMLKR